MNGTKHHKTIAALLIAFCCISNATQAQTIVCKRLPSGAVVCVAGSRGF
jgi:hypothetical protein